MSEIAGSAGSPLAGVTPSIPGEQATEKKNTRVYVLFHVVDDERKLLQEIGEAEASSPENALRILVPNPADAVGKKFRAVPQRNISDLAPKLQPEKLTF